MPPSFNAEGQWQATKSSLNANDLEELDKDYQEMIVCFDEKSAVLFCLMKKTKNDYDAITIFHP